MGRAGRPRHAALLGVLLVAAAAAGAGCQNPFASDGGTAAEAVDAWFPLGPAGRTWTFDLGEPLVFPPAAPPGAGRVPTTADCRQRSTKRSEGWIETAEIGRVFEIIDSLWLDDGCDGVPLPGSPVSAQVKLA